MEIGNTSNFGSLELLAKQVVEGFITGLHKSPFHGFSVEFAEHRLYNTGDHTKNIDWKLFAKTDKLFVKKYEEETNLRCYLFIDQSSSMYYPPVGVNKINFSIQSAAALIYLLKKQRDAFGMATFSDRVDFFSEAKSTTIHQKLIFSELERLVKKPVATASTGIASCLHELAEKVHQRSLVIIFSDMVDTTNQLEVFNALQHLKHNKHEVVLFHVHQKKTEVDFQFDNKPYLFVDAETEEQVKLFPAQVREIYQTQYQQYIQELKEKCHQYKIDVVPANIEEGFDTILKTYLIKRSRMG